MYGEFTDVGGHNPHIIWKEETGGAKKAEEEACDDYTNEDGSKWFNQQHYSCADFDRRPHWCAPYGGKTDVHGHGASTMCCVCKGGTKSNKLAGRTKGSRLYGTFTEIGHPGFYPFTGAVRDGYFFGVDYGDAKIYKLNTRNGDRTVYSSV
mmetsp:Transcript_93342/g.129625  ORF Transcript_93342/g.129625 Transcript_93342/m.129625 type:complete len:151 (-) Transcript_93342:385-837(-)